MELANRGKRSIGLDITLPSGAALLLDLVATADVFLTNFLPSTLDRLGLGVDEVRRVNPKVIYARGHGQGVRGPDADMPSYDATSFWARGGLGDSLRPLGAGPPIEGRYALGDRNAASQLAFGVAAALFRRERTGEPSVIDVSLLATAIWSLGSDVISALQGNFASSFVGGEPSRHRPNPLVNTYATKDGRFVHLAFLRPERWWADLAWAIDRPELTGDPRFVDHRARLANRGDLVDILEKTFSSRTLEEWRYAFSGVRFPWAPFQQIPEVVDDPQVVANSYIGGVEVEGAEPFRLPTGAVQIDERPPVLRRAPEHGQDTEAILLELGLDWDDIAGLQQAGVVI